MLIADIGAVPYITIKSNVKSKSHGYPAWNRMVNMYRESHDDNAKHYNRRSVIESVFSNEEEDAIFNKVKDIS